MRQLLLATSCLVFSTLAYAEAVPTRALPKADEIFTIAVYPYRSDVPKPYFTPESLLQALPQFRPGEAEIKVGARRFWQQGVIVLRSKEVLFWTTCRKNFIHILTPTGYVSFIIGDGKDDL
jgi:hypothetical protein